MVGVLGGGAWGSHSQECEAVQSAFWALHAGKILFSLKADKKAGSKIEHTSYVVWD